MNKSKIVIASFFVLVSSCINAAYTPSTAVSYAVNNYNLPYSTTSNPFINVSGVGGNCTNFANQTISSGIKIYFLNQLLLRQFKIPAYSINVIL